MTKSRELPPRISPAGRPGLENIRAYKGGIHSIKGNDNPIILSSNENPYGCAPKVRSLFGDSTIHINRYPEEGNKGLITVLADHYRLDPDEIICGNGSDELLQLIAMAFAGPGDEVIHTEHGFLLYPLVAQRVGAQPVTIKEKNLKSSPHEILKAVSPRTKIVFIANPNNPTGGYLNAHELTTLCEGLDPSVLLVIDAAYHEYAINVPDYPDAMDYARRYHNVVVTRTFSKAYGLAGMRVGWMYGNKKLISIVKKVCAPFNISILGTACAELALAEHDFITSSVQKNNECLDWFRIQCSKIDSITSFPSSIANFQLLGYKTRGMTEKVYDHLVSKGIIARKVRAYGLSCYLRVSIGTRAEMEQVVTALGTVSQMPASTTNSKAHLICNDT